VVNNSNISPNERLLQLIRPLGKAETEPGEVKKRPAASRAQDRRRRLPLFGRQVHIGVDISPSRLVCVKARGQDADYKVLGATIVPLAEGVEPGSEAFVASLGQTLSALCVPGEKPQIWAASLNARTNIQYVTIPKVASRQVDNAVFWTAKKEMGFEESAVVFDFERRGEVAEKGAARLGALAYTVDRVAVSRVTDAFAKAGYPLSGLTMEPFAHQNLFRRHVLPGTGGATANLHVGRNWSRLEIYNNGSLMFMRVIKTSMAGMEEAVLEALETRQGAGAGTSVPPPSPSEAPQAPIPAPADGSGESVVDLDSLGTGDAGFVLELDAPMEPAPQATTPPAPGTSPVRPEDARELFECIIFGCEALSEANPGHGLDESEIMAMLEPAASRLVRQVEMTLKHFRESLGFEAVASLTVSGALGASRFFTDYIGEQLGLPCRALDPLGAHAQKGWLGPELAEPSVEYAQALGLALSDAAITPNALCTYREKAEARSARSLEQGTLVVLALLLLGLAFFSLDALWNRQKLTGERDTLTRELQSLGGKPDLPALTRKVAELKSRRDAARAYADRARILGLWGTVLSLAPGDVGVGNLTAEFAPPKDVPKAGAAKKSAPQPAVAPGRVVLTGMITGDSRLFDSKLASFVVALEGATLFESVSVKQNELEALGGGATGLRFMIVLTVPES
jgi:Tfp pilus assembly PilM family ATPase